MSHPKGSLVAEADAHALIGKRVRVHAPKTEDTPCSFLHGDVVTIRGMSPKHPEVWRTSGGPLQWSRRALRVRVVP